MWFFLFGTGAVLLHRVDWTAGLGSWLPHPPPPWAPFALYFLAAALLRLAIRDARLRPLRKKAKALAAAGAPAPVGVAEFGMGVGKGLASVVVGGDFLGALWAGVDLLARWLGSPRERSRRRVSVAVRETMSRERRRAIACIASLGLICAAQAIRPDLLPRFTSQALALAGVGF